MDKTRIGGQSDVVAQANKEFDRANRAEAELTMMRRRIRTFFLEISEVSFPEDAPSWAPDWVEWLATGIVAKVAVEEVVEEAPTEEALMKEPSTAPVNDVTEAQAEAQAGQDDLAAETPTT